MKKYFHAIAALLMTSTIGMAQAPQGLRTFQVLTPEVITQDRPFQVIYHLEANTWDSIPAPDFKGYELMESVWNTKDLGDGYKELDLSCTLRAPRSGPQQLPQLNVSIRGEKITATGTEIDVKPNAEHGWEIDASYRFLADNGIDADTVLLKGLGTYGNLWFINDPHSGVFTVVANKSFADKLDSPILAYGLAGSYRSNDLDVDGSISKIFSIYSWQLDEIAASGMRWINTSSFDSSLSDVKPLLGATAWAQSSPFNCAFPTSGDQHTITGCGPLALAQLMYSYKWPEKVSADKPYSIDWYKAKDRYGKEETEEARWLSEAILDIAKGLGATIGTTNTSSSLSDVKQLLQRQYGYSPMMYLYKKKSDREMLSLIHNELTNKRPALISDEGHIFVCDGRQGSFLHFNFGWGGLHNGYYRTSLIDSMTDEQLSVQNAVLGITPLRSTLHKDVVMIEPGTLSTKWTAEELERVNSLKVIGPVNGSDIVFMRKLLGATASEDPNGTHGAVSHIDLSDAIIVEGETPYFELDITGSKTMVTRSQRENGVVMNEITEEITFDSNISDELLQLFTNSNQDNMRYEKRDGRIITSYRTKANTIGVNMFAKCPNLIEMTLPTNIEAVCQDAFSYNSSLESVRITGTFKNNLSATPVSDIFYSTPSFCKKFVKY